MLGLWTEEDNAAPGHHLRTMQSCFRLREELEVIKELRELHKEDLKAITGGVAVYRPDLKMEVYIDVGRAWAVGGPEAARQVIEEHASE